jgi:hypothetical protein
MSINVYQSSQCNSQKRIVFILIPFILLYVYYCIFVVSVHTSDTKPLEVLSPNHKFAS